jgi:HEAT repeat protein
MTAAALSLALGLAQAALPQDSAHLAPDLVLSAPADAGLAARAAWADRTARDRQFASWWIGWSIAGDTTGRTWYYIDRNSPVHNSATFSMGAIRITGSGGELQFAGVNLRPLVGAASPHETVVLLRYTMRDGRPALERVHVGSYAFPVHFSGGALLWLGGAADEESALALRSAFGATADPVLQRDLVGAVGAHQTSASAAPVLRAWLDNAALLSATRREAADWLGHHRHADAVTALSNAARADTSVTVRTTAARALARAAAPNVATEFLARLAREDGDARVRREAIAALGTIRDERAFRALVEFVEEPGDSLQNATRRQALSVVSGQSQPRGPRQPQEVIDLLVRIARNDADGSVRTSAVDGLANLRDPRVLPILVDIATNHSDVRVQQRATQGLGRTEPASGAIDPLRRLTWEHARPEVQNTAVRALAQLRTEDVRPLLADIAERHPRPEVRRVALQAVLDQRLR